MPLPLSKKQKLKNEIAKGDWKKALGIAKSFTIEFNKDEQRILQISHECWDNQSRINFYSGMGVDVDKTKAQAIHLLENYK